MNTEKMTIHEALAELKIMDDRIVKALNAIPLVVANKHTNAKINGIAVSDYCGQMKAGYQKSVDLITRRNAIKRAVVLSNATTKVVVAGTEYSVAEAIEMKNHGVTYLRDLLNKMEMDYKRAQLEASRNNGDALENRADEYVRSLCGNTDMKNASDEVKKLRSDFIAAQTYELVDPIKVKEQMELLEQKISDFMTKVDAALRIGLSGEYVAAGISAWLDNSEFDLYRGGYPPHYGDVAKW